jgi:hypothetical protein
MIQRLEVRLTTSLITRSNILEHQGSSTLPATYQSISSRKKRLSTDSSTAMVKTKTTDIDHSSLLRTLLLRLTRLLSFFVAPFGYFEMWSSFRPEEYTINDAGPQVICYSIIPVDTYATIATATHDLIVAKNLHCWIRIKLRITAAIGTTYWQVLVQDKLKRASHIGWRQLPDRFISLVKDQVINHPHILDDTEINIRYDKEFDAKGGDSNPKVIGRMRILDTSVRDNMENLTEVLRHQNVRIISEAALVSVYIQGICLVANINNQWVAYRPVTAGQLGMDLLWRGIQAGVALRGASHSHS